MHPSRKVQIAYLKADEALTKILRMYADFADIFLPKLTTELRKYTEINNHAIELIDDWQRLYGPIYSLGPVKLEILKTYIKDILANGFIRPFKSPAGASIFFDKKLDGNLKLCVDYQDFNNLTIKNWYPLSLLRESINRLGWA